jgi:glutathione synthase/RimK-type ligase-like ATP-grasp enzyme
MSKTLIVLDEAEDLELEDKELSTISFEQYLTDYPRHDEPRTRVINLCDTEHYLSRGYYCSLLAEARQHRVLPTVSTINDLRDLTSSPGSGLALTLPADLLAEAADSEPQTVLAYFGWAEAPAWQKLARQVFDRYPAPILQFELSRDAGGLMLRVQRYAYASLSSQERKEFLPRLSKFAERAWRGRSARRQARWDMAILVNPDEPNPPSDKEAIKRFLRAAGKVGINAETITIQQAGNIAEYDALFIRETTAIDHHTYRLARRAEQEGLLVIDDSASILRCCNKVFLHDAFTYNRVPSLKTRFVIDSSEAQLQAIEQEFGYPLVIKMPEGAFSRGVYKVENREALRSQLEALLADTALVLVQEYLYTDFDWRIGVLNGRPLYACRYHMARNHWQIYNHGVSRGAAGDSETLPTFEAPKAVLNAALKAAAMVGKGLYGVDLKQKDRQVYVIEVNDNPSIDHKVEDLYLGNELYMQIMAEFAQRLDQRGR